MWFGEFTLRRFVFRGAGGQRQEYAPLDARLQLPECAFVLQDWGQGLAVEFSFKQV